MRSLRTAALLAVSLLSLHACKVVGPDYEAPEIQVPDQWHRELTSGLEAGTSNLHAWWTTLGDEQLVTLIQRAASGNQDLEIAFARILQARAARGVATGELYPDITADGSFERFRTSEGLMSMPAPPFSRTDSKGSVGLNATWELDVFGGIRRSIESADATLQSTIEGYRDTLVVLLADVASTYVEVRTLQARIQYAESNVENQALTLELTRDRVNSEISPKLDVRQAELNLARTEAVLPSLREQLHRAIYRLGVLLGEHPTALYDELIQPGPIPAPTELVAMDIPFSLVRQRPDLRRAERVLAASTARIGMASANLYPRFALTGSFAYAAQDDLFDDGNRAWSVGPAASWNLFNGGRVRNLVKQEDANTQEALVRYEQTVLVALQEVESAIVAFDEEQLRRDILKRSVTAASESVELVKTLYRNGLTDFQNVLDTERSLFEQQDLLAESEGRVIRNLVELYRALGGGWDPDPVIDAELQDQADNGEPIF